MKCLFCPKDGKGGWLGRVSRGLYVGLRKERRKTVLALRVCEYVVRLLSASEDWGLRLTMVEIETRSRDVVSC